MTEKHPIVGPEGLAGSIIALARQISAVEKSADLKIEVLQRETKIENSAAQRFAGEKSGLGAS